MTLSDLPEDSDIRDQFAVIKTLAVSVNNNDITEIQTEAQPKQSEEKPLNENDEFDIKYAALPDIISNVSDITIMQQQVSAPV